MKPWFPILALVLVALLGAQHEAGAGTTRAGRAAALFASASRRLAIGSHAQRQLAVTELEDAAKLDPKRTDIALALGRLYMGAELLHRANDLAQRLVVADSANAEAWLFLGQTWKRDWLVSADETSRDRAIVCAARSARLAPKRPGAWALLAPLLVDTEEFESAHDVAVFAARAAPADAEAQVQVAATAQRLGDVGKAEAIYRKALPRLPAAERERYDDVAPLLPPWSVEGYLALSPEARRSFVARFWADNDPDPVAVENSARLEYWTRVTQALALYGTARAGEWDMRAQYYVRYGQPDIQVMNPVDKPRILRAGDWLAWGYPGLGLRIWIGSSSSTLGFPEGISSRVVSAHPSPDSVGRHGELTAFDSGWAIFHRLPPGVTPIETRLATSTFITDAGHSLFAQAESPGGLEDHFSTRWVVLDSTATPVVRSEEQAMSASACEPEHGRAASFTAALPPGAYSLAVEVSDDGNRRGTARRNLLVPHVPDRLALSDLVVTCSPAQRSMLAGPSVRLEPQTGLFPERGDQLNVYFEIYHLASAEDGNSRFVYDCLVRPAERDRRGWMSRMLMPQDEPPPIHMSRAETTAGPLRRQFLSVPVGALPAGRYVIEVLVRDVTSDVEAQSVASFERRP